MALQTWLTHALSSSAGAAVHPLALCPPAAQHAPLLWPLVLQACHLQNSDPDPAVHVGPGGEVGWLGSMMGESFGWQLTALASFAGGKIQEQKHDAWSSGAVHSGSYSYRSTGKVWQAASVGKLPTDTIARPFLELHMIHTRDFV